MRFRSFLPLALLALGTAACDTGEAPSLYDPIAEGTYRAKADPVVNDIVPPSGQALAGVTTLTINGQNFVPSAPSDSAMVNGVKTKVVKDSTYVYVNGVRIPTLLSVTPTQITFRAPNVVSAGAQVKVSVLGAANFSQTKTYALLAAVERVGALKNNEQPISMTTDRTGGTYTSLLIGGAPGGIRKTNAQGVDSLYAPGAATYATLAWSPQAGGLFGGRNNRALYQIVKGVGDVIFYDFANSNDRNLRVRALDADEAGNLWVGGSNTVAFYRVTPAKTVLTVPYTGSILAIETRSDAVYVSAIEGTTNKVLRFPLSGTTVGAPQTVLDVTAAFPGVQVTALAFAANGDLFLGTNRTTDPVLQLRAGQTTAETLYPGLLVSDTSPGISPGVTGLSWGLGSLLHAAGVEIVAEAASRNALGDVVRINTLRQGEH